jgi:UDP-N-acetylglucosamine 2-epimerase
MKIITIVGARPQFIKASPVSKQIRKNHKEILVHTGQHYDHNMSKNFFDELEIPEPDYNLGINSGSQQEQIGRMIIEISKIILKEKPNLVMVYGDTNSTLAGAIATNKANVKLVHIEAGLRSFDKSIPEEVNRILVSHCSDLLLCPTKVAVKNLENEGVKSKIFNIGDVMYDTILEFEKKGKIEILEKLQIKPKNYILATVHRQSNTDKKENLKEILKAFKGSEEKIVFPIHPRTKKSLKKHNLSVQHQNILTIDPVSYLEMIVLQKNAKKIITDSGGIQKEAFFLGTPCITLRENTEWTETVENGWNILVGTDKEKILNAIKNFNPAQERKNHYGDGKAAEKICKILEDPINFS